MASPDPKFATVIHLSTGHVLASVTAVGLEPKLDTLTGGHVRVRVPGSDLYVKVPSANVTATRIAVTTNDLLDQPLDFALKTSQNAPPVLSFLGEPVSAPQSGAQGDDVVMAWQDGQNALVTVGKLGPSGTLPATAPPGASAELVAIAGKPLSIRKLP